MYQLLNFRGALAADFTKLLGNLFGGVIGDFVFDATRNKLLFNLSAYAFGAGADMLR